MSHRNTSTPPATFGQPENCAVTGCSAISLYEKELEKHRATEAALTSALAREQALVGQKDALIQQREILCKESEHRFLNGLQLIASLLTMQARATRNAEAATQLRIAGGRVAAIGRVHRHLHALDSLESVEFKPYLEHLCADLADMAAGKRARKTLVVEGVDLKIPTTVAIPLGFVASELVTNAIKYGTGRIRVGLRTTADDKFELSVSDDGPGLPEGFNPEVSDGLGMKLVSSLVAQIGGGLQFGRGDNGKGARFSVIFPGVLGPVIPPSF